MADTTNQKLDQIIAMLGQMQRTIGELAGDVQRIRDHQDREEEATSQTSK
jgi:hypothetical protein